jgi:hypothetical protein
VAYTAEAASEPVGEVVEFTAPGGLGTVEQRLTIRPASGPAWTGDFRGLANGVGSTFFETWPDARMLLVCVSGYAHYFRSDDQQHRLELPVFPVIDQIRSGDIVVLADFTTLAAVDGDGLLWASPRLASDEIVDLRMEDGVVMGSGNDAATQTWKPFAISIRRGELRDEGGSNS